MFNSICLTYRLVGLDWVGSQVNGAKEIGASGGVERAEEVDNVGRPAGGTAAVATGVSSSSHGGKVTKKKGE